MVAEIVEQQLAEERHTIDIRIDQSLALKAPQLAAQMVKDNQDWVATERERIQLEYENDERKRKWLNWFLGVVGRSANTTVFFVLWGVVTAGWGWAGGINTPMKITCSTRTSLCYQVRIRAVKSALSDLPNPGCDRLIQTDKGLLCQFHKPSPPRHSDSVPQK